MIMKVAVPLPKHSPMFGQEASSHTVCSLLLAQDALDLVEARAAAGAHADPLGLAQRLGGHHLDRDARGLEPSTSPR